MHKEEEVFVLGYRVDAQGRLLNPQGRVLRGSRDSNGYPRIARKGKPPVPVHQLAAFQKFGCAMYRKGIEVRHKNGDHTDARPSNILLGTHSQNMLDVPKDVRLARSRAAARVQRSLSDKEVRAMRADHEAGMPYSKLVVRYGIAKSTVAFVIQGKTYRDV